MRKLVFAILSLVAVHSASPSFAAITVSLSSSPGGSPVVLLAGETITVDVVISGIGGSGNPISLNELGVTLNFDSASLSAFGVPTFGPIVPVPVDGVFDVDDTSSPGAVQGLYDILIPSGGVDAPISTNGLFFQFSLQAKKVGSTTISAIEFFDASYFDELDNFGTAEFGESLNVQVVGSTSAVPEPTSWSLFAFGLGIAAICIGRNRLRWQVRR